MWEILARQTTVSIQTGKSSSSGTIVRRQGQTYTVLTNCHVVAIVRGDRTIVTDDLLHRPLGVPRRLRDTALAIVEFLCAIEYKVAPSRRRACSGGRATAIGPIPCRCTGVGCSAGVRRTAAAQIFASRLCLGYTNEVKIGMSGGPIFNAKGFLVGINGRGKYRDPDFGVYAFEDATKPTAELLEKMVKWSWGIPISIYWQFVSSHLGS